MNFPPVFRARSQLYRAVLAPPTCNDPVGDGANLTRTGPNFILTVLPFDVNLRSVGIEENHFLGNINPPGELDVEVRKDWTRQRSMKKQVRQTTTFKIISATLNFIYKINRIVNLRINIRELFIEYVTNYRISSPQLACHFVLKINVRLHLH